MSLSVQQLSVSFGSTLAVNDLTLAVDGGERFAVMGSSGSGKSTLLRAIAGLVPIDSGAITLDGEDVTGVPAHRRPVGLMFQDYALFPHMTVSENIGYGLRMAGVPARAREIRSRELLGLVGLDGFADRKPTTLSGGEQQRVALARTLAPEPSVVLLDEPLGSLDISLRESLLSETRSILDGVGATSLYVTHDRTEAFAFCDRMAIMHEGQILRVGSPDEIWHEPRSEFVARAIGQSNLVLFNAIARGRSGLVFVPRDAIRVHDHGRLTGAVETSRFEDGTRLASVRFSDGTSTLEMQVILDFSHGSKVHFDIDYDQLIIVSTDEV
jgi:thiamine transport system ATP-binding protein